MGDNHDDTPDVLISIREVCPRVEDHIANEHGFMVPLCAFNQLQSNKWGGKWNKKWCSCSQQTCCWCLLTFKQPLTPIRFSLGFQGKVKKVGEIIRRLREPSAFILAAPVPFQVVPLSFQTQHPAQSTEKRATAAILLWYSFIGLVNNIYIFSQAKSSKQWEPSGLKCMKSLAKFTTSLCPDRKSKTGTNCSSSDGDQSIQRVNPKCL